MAPRESPQSIVEICNPCISVSTGEGYVYEAYPSPIEGGVGAFTPPQSIVETCNPGISYGRGVWGVYASTEECGLSVSTE